MLPSVSGMEVIPPLHEKIFKEEMRSLLYNMYCKLYTADSITKVPLRHEEFSQVEVFGQLFTFLKSRSQRSSTVSAMWPGLSGTIIGRQCSVEDIRCGNIEYFIYIL